MKKFDDNFSYLKVLSGGQTTSLQDFGRYGHQDKGEDCQFKIKISGKKRKLRKCQRKT